jgi:LPS-assembly protein
LAQVIRDKSNPDLPVSTTLNEKYSDIIGKVKFNLMDNLNFEYNFMMDNNLHKTNYNSIIADISVNNFLSSFEYVEEKDFVGTKSFVSNTTSYLFDENNSIKFSTRRNREIDLTEFYNLVYQYENDCLKAALEYNKTYYSDSDIKPEEEIFFSLTIIPFTKINTTNLK